MPGLPSKFMSSGPPAAPPTQLDAGALGFCQSDVSRDRKFGERRHGPYARRSSVFGTSNLFARRLHCQLAIPLVVPTLANDAQGPHRRPGRRL